MVCYRQSLPLNPSILKAMSTVDIRRSISRVLDSVEDERFLSSVLSMVMAYSNTPSKLSEGQLTELQRRVEARESDSNPGTPWRDSLKSVREGL